MTSILAEHRLSSLPTRMIEFLACPSCRGLLITQDQERGLYCSGCNEKYLYQDGIPILVPKSIPEFLKESWKLWEQLQENGKLSYELAPELNLFADGGPYAEAFGEFMQLTGLTLDVGCGPQRGFPRYAAKLSSNSYIGVDPLRGALQRDFSFVQGLAECLPFQAGLFDNVVFCSSLDHLMSIESGLSEAARVLGSQGKLYILVDCFEQGPGRRGTLSRVLDFSKRALRQLSLGFLQMGPWRTIRYARELSSRAVPKGAFDYFHMNLRSLPEIEAMLLTSRFKVVRRLRFRDVVFLHSERSY